MTQVEELLSLLSRRDGRGSLAEEVKPFPVYLKQECLLLRML